MHIEYVCHSCLFIDTGEHKLLFDPWFHGPAYRNQWYVFPKPVDLSMMDKIDVVLYTHGHEDHLHGPSLTTLDKNIKVFYPYQWKEGIKKFFTEKGFYHLTEAVSYKKYSLGKKTFITYIGFALESIVVIEHNGKVIVNLNDALNSHHQHVVDMFIKEINKHWPVIDILFSGFSGAGYFPNTVHYKDKDDKEVGRLREQYFCNHLCKIIKQLNPKVAVPFAPGFVLLKPDKRWINEIKFPREHFEAYYKKFYDNKTHIKFHIVQPGDYIIDDDYFPISPYHAIFKKQDLNKIIESQYSNEIFEHQQVLLIDSTSIDPIPGIVEDHLNENHFLFDKSVLQEAQFSIFLSDSPHRNFLNVSYVSEKFIVREEKEKHRECNLVITTTSDLLLHAIKEEWGGDALTIGYGLDVEILKEDALEKNLDIVCVRLLTKYPMASKSLKKNPLRAAQYFLRHPMMSKLLIKQKLLMRNTVNKFPYNERDHWISFTKCELCMVCNMPLLSHNFGELLNERN